MDEDFETTEEDKRPNDMGYEVPIPHTVESHIPTIDTTQTEKPNDSYYLLNGDAQAILEEAPTLDAGLSLLSESYQSKNWDKPEEAAKIAGDYAKELRFRFKDKSLYSTNDIGKLSPFSLKEFDGEPLERVDAWEKANTEFLDTTTDPDYVLVRDKLKNSITSTASNLRREGRSDERGTLSNAVQDTFFRILEGATAAPATLVGLDGYVKGLKERTDPSFDDDIISDITQGVGMLGGMTASAVGGPAGVSGYLAAQGGGQVKRVYDESLAATGDKERATTASVIEGGSQVIQTVIAGKLFSGPAKAIAARVRGIPLEKVTTDTFTRVGGAALVEAGTNAIGGMISNYAQGYGTDNPNIGVFDNTGRSALVGALFGAGIGGIDVATNPTARADPAVLNGGVIPPVESSIIGGVLDPETTARMQVEGDVPQPSFKTVDGNIYVETDDGATARTKTSSSEGFHPFDKTFYVDKGTAVKLGALRDAQQADGSLARVLTDGNRLLIKGGFVNEDLTLSKEPTGGRLVEVPVESTPSPGLHPVEVNRPKNIDGNQREYRSHIGKEIAEVIAPPKVEGQSVGAMSILDTLERGISRKVRLSPVLGEKVTEVFGDKELGLDRYFKVTDVSLKNNANQVIGAQGIEGATRDFLGLPEDYANPQSIEIARQLIHQYDIAAENALAAGDSVGQERLSGLAADVVGKASRIATNSGQTISAFRLWESINPATQLASIRNELNNKAVAEVAAETGQQIKDLTTLDKNLETTVIELDTLQKEGQKRQDTQINELETAIKSIEEGAEARTADEVRGAKEDLVATKARISELENEKKAFQAKAGEGSAEGAPVKQFPKGKEKELERLNKTLAKIEEKLAVEKQPLTPKERTQVDRLRKAVSEERGKVVKDYLGEGERTRIEDLLKKRDTLSSVKDKVTERKKEWQKKLSPEKEARLTKLLKVLPTLQEGTSNFSKVKNKVDELKLEALGETPSREKRNLIYSLWNANVLSNVATHFSNIKGTALNTAGTPISLALTGQFGEAGAYFKGFIDSIPDAVTKAKIAFNTGETATRTGRVQAEIGGDLVDSNIPILSKMGYVLRALTAEDEFFFHANKEGYARAAAYHAGKEKGLTAGSTEFDSYVGEQLYNSETNWSASLNEAKNQADALKEAGIETSEKQLLLNAWELMDGKRNSDIQADSTRMALATTLNEVPKGALGMVYQGLNQISNLPINFNGIEVRPVKYFLPFLRTTMNMASSYLDYFPPVGAFRASQSSELRFEKGGKFGELTPKPALQQHMELGKAVAGTLATGMLLGIAESFLDDKDPLFAIYGMGPKDTKTKIQMVAEGWVPNSIKVGNTFIKYADTPLVYVLGSLGSLHDNKRWNKKFARENAANQLAIGVMGMMGSFASNSFLKNINTLLNTINDEQGYSSGDKISQVLANMGKGFIPASGALRFLSNAVDDPIDTKGDFWSKFISGVPFVETLGTNPALNAFGKPVGRTFEERSNILARVYQRRESDPNWRWLAENGYSIPDPGGFNTTLSKSNKAVNKRREETLGPAYVGIMSHEERYELTKKAGPRIERIVDKYRARYGVSGYQEKVQERLNKEIHDAMSDTKKEMKLQ